MCSPPVLGTETISQGLPAAKQDESCIKIDSGHFDYLTDMITSHFLARAKLKEPLQVALVYIHPFIGKTNLLVFSHCNLLNSVLRGYPSLDM